MKVCVSEWVNPKCIYTNHAISDSFQYIHRSQYICTWRYIGKPIVSMVVYTLYRTTQIWMSNVIPYRIVNRFGSFQRILLSINKSNCLSCQKYYTPLFYCVLVYLANISYKYRKPKQTPYVPVSICPCPRKFFAKKEFDSVYEIFSEAMSKTAHGNITFLLNRKVVANNNNSNLRSFVRFSFIHHSNNASRCRILSMPSDHPHHCRACFWKIV